MKYQKKPIIIDAVQWLATKTSWDEIMNMGNIQWKPSPYTASESFIIKTLEGEHIASKNDFIIKGVEGEFYPCKPNIFNKTYEPIPITTSDTNIDTNSCQNKKNANERNDTK